ncbi:hypothetical protein OEV98_06355 [Caldibacillus lycopersici]|uniref:Alpha-L-rhamnosidase six-hairpin glycosidase domain-containing protein n=1 Tax=Perspicuibacillus lycopersici TaxID=1325689 RepID=A0AAE3IS22_9BACI|nr:hypothetical protein [Perspicuibacillus lycopersici]MCU9613172.1 hypothetical protein [Perspicuibacillus lycopersici]
MVNIQDLKERIVSPDERHFVTPGNRMHLIGSQNGSFPAFGHHVEDEMGGLWMHPIKILDGFWFGLKEKAAAETQWLKNATEFINYPFYNENIYQMDTISVKRTHFAPDDIPGFLVKYELENTTAEELEFTANWLARSDLRPVWYSETKGILPGEDHAFMKEGTVIVKDSQHQWFAGICVDVENAKITIEKDLTAYDGIHGSGCGMAWEFTMTLPPGAKKAFTVRIAGSMESEAEIQSVLTALIDGEHLFQQKRQRYQEILNMADINIPDKELEKVYAWVKCHIDWLTIDVPTVGKGLAAGIPEYSWWFGTDSAYALMGCLPAGFHQLSENTLDLVGRLSKEHNKNGRIIHEANTFGIVGNPGNTQETAHFIIALFETYLWSGNTQWLRNHYPEVKAGLRWILEDMDQDHDLYPEGYGIIEILGLNAELIDTAVYTWKALTYAAEMGRMFTDVETANHYEELAKQLAQKIQTEMWLEEEGLFGDIRISGNDIYSKLDDFITQASLGNDYETISYYQMVKEDLERTGLHQDKAEQTWCFKNWVINTPVETGLASEEQAEIALRRMNSDEFIGDYGMYLSGIGGTSGRRMMTISTGVQINANLQYNQTDSALALIQKIKKTFNMYLPGSISEMSPDYGCFVQAWTSYGMIAPFITGFIGMKPNAGQKKVVFAPQLPDAWDQMEAKQIKIGNNLVDVKVTRVVNGYQVEVTSNEQGWIFAGADGVELLQREVNEINR